jgi:hypothetical protein
MPQGKGTYGSVQGRPPKKKKKVTVAKGKKLKKNQSKKNLKNLMT